MCEETKLSPEFVEKIQSLVDAASPESLAVLLSLLEKEEDNEKIAHLENAYDEAAYTHYTPQNEAEEKDLQIALLMDEKMDEIEAIEEELEELKAEMADLELHRSIHAKILAENPDRAEDWKPHFEGEMMNKIAPDLMSRREYLGAWMEAARDSIENKKYLEVPQSVIEDFMDDGCCDEDCDCEECNEEESGECECCK